MDEGNPLMELHGNFIVWSSEVIWQIKNIVSLLPKDLWAPMKSHNPLTMWSCGAKCQTKNIMFPLLQDHQTLQGGNLGWAEFTHEVTWPSDHVVTWQIKEVILISHLCAMTTKGHKTSWENCPHHKILICLVTTWLDSCGCPSP